MSYSRIVSSIVFPVQQFVLGGGTLQYINRWEKTQWLSADELADLQLRKLHALVEHAAASVPFYRRTFREIGFKPNDLKTVDDLACLPVLTKSVLREHSQEFITEGLTEKLRTAKTGGSTGEPLVFPIGNSLRAASVANMVRCRRWWGIETGDRSVNFWGHSRYIRQRPSDRIKKKLTAVKNRILNRIVCSAYEMNDESMQRYWQKVLRFQPAFLIGYATTLFTFADFLLRNRIDTSRLKLKAVISTAEVLYDWQADTINTAFGCPVVNEYGMCETGVVAYACPSGSMHLMDEAYITEILPVEGSTSGDIVVTELENPAVPLIRYNTKDMAKRVNGPCECGRGLSRISKVEGRAYDIVYASDGTAVAGALLTHTMKSLGGIERYQILQKDLTTLEISYTGSKELTDSDTTFILDTLRRHLGSQVKVHITRVEDISKELSGKHRWLKSLVTTEQAHSAREKKI